jgi:hypothetical protein
MRDVMLSEAKGRPNWSIALVGMRHDEEALMPHPTGRSRHKTQPYRNLAGGSTAPAEHQRSENTLQALGREGKLAQTTTER